MKTDPRLYFTLAVLSILALFVGSSAILINAADRPAPERELMDSPIPPGDIPPGKKIKCLSDDCPESPAPTAEVVRALWKGLDGNGNGYCLTFVTPDGVTTNVKVPFHRPDFNNGLEGLRRSVANAVKHTAREYEGRCVRALAGKRDALAEVAACRSSAESFAARAAGVRFSWEVPATLAGSGGLATEAGKPTIVGDDGGVTCTCSTFVGSDVVPGPACSGGCGNCWTCR